MSDVKKVGVLGCGLMGSGIAEVCAKAGYSTIVREISGEVVERGRGAIEKSLGRAVEKGRLSGDDRDAILGRLEFTTSLKDLKDVDIVIEAVVEDLELKREMFGELDKICPEHTIFASNTSSLTIADMAVAAGRADRMVGLHFFNPVPVMKLVEVVRTITTSDDTFKAAMRFAESVGKEPVACKDNSGFIVNRLLVPYMLDAIRALESGVGSMTDIDKAMQLGLGHPMGPFILGDFVGLDTLLKVGEIMFDEYRESRFAPPPLLKRMISAGYYGRKSGRGFYDYSEDKPRPVDLGL